MLKSCVKEFCFSTTMTNRTGQKKTFSIEEKKKQRIPILFSRFGASDRPRQSLRVQLVTHTKEERRLELEKIENLKRQLAEEKLEATQVRKTPRRQIKWSWSGVRRGRADQAVAEMT